MQKQPESARQTAGEESWSWARGSWPGDPPLAIQMPPCLLSTWPFELLGEMPQISHRLMDVLLVFCVLLCHRSAERLRLPWLTHHADVLAVSQPVLPHLLPSWSWGEATPWFLTVGLLSFICPLLSCPSLAQAWKHCLTLCTYVSPFLPTPLQAHRVPDTFSGICLSSARPARCLSQCPPTPTPPRRPVNVPEALLFPPDSRIRRTSPPPEFCETSSSGPASALPQVQGGHLDLHVLFTVQTSNDPPS